MAFAEIAKFPSAVLAHHYPHIPNLGDVTKINWKEFVDRNEPVQLVVFGSPCQSFSVAGRRLGLDDPRGNLALHALRIVNVVRPRWFIFENVPGLLSSDGGRAFGAFLQTVGDCGYQCAWRVLDAQYFGLAQRRKRLFVVGHLGDWRGPAAVLFESESMSGNPPPSRHPEETVTGTVTSCTGDGRGRKHGFGWGQQEFENGFIVPTGFEVGPGNNGWTDLSPTLDARCKDGPIRNQIGLGVIEPIAFALRGREGGAMPEMEGDCAGALRAAAGGSSRSYIAGSFGVRRITPLEVERLMGFPDDYTRIPWRGREADLCPDGPRYSSVGNSFPVPVIHWIGHRVQMVDALLSR